MRKIQDGIDILRQIGLPEQQQNERTALVLLALVDLQPASNWNQANARLIGVTPIMDWIAQHYDKKYQPNTRETIRRQSLHQMVAAGVVEYNPDKQDRPPNSPHTTYRISAEALTLLQSFGTADWVDKLAAFLTNQPSLIVRYAAVREQVRVPVRDAAGNEFTLTPGDHSELIRQIIEEFAPHYLPGSTLLYVGDTEDKWQKFEREYLDTLGVVVDEHGKMPDVVLHDVTRHWLVLVEAVTSHGPVDGKRHHELATLFSGSTEGLVYVTAFPDRRIMAGYLGMIAWETEVWVASDPTHLIHFNGERFLGPYK